MFFLNPLAMVVGGAMVSAPILIHLINRMRFKRVRWAAMEFLLKSQKRNRRRLIIEQLILLMLRCLLILLLGFLVARFVGEALGRTASSSTTHVVLIDDTLSMADRAPKNQSSLPDCFEQAKKHIEELAAAAADAPSAQTLIVLRMSQREQPVFNDRLSEDSLGTLRNDLKKLTPTLMHIDPAEAVESANQLLANARESKRWLHVISDFRDHDWGNRPANEKLHNSLKAIADSGTQITLIDTAVPPRSSRSRSLEYHNNFAITDFRPDKRVAPAGTAIPFTLTVENLGSETRDSIFIEVFVDGSENLLVSQDYSPVPSPGGSHTYTFEMRFEGPAEGGRSRFHRVTARLKDLDKQSGILADNVRHAIIEIRPKSDPISKRESGVPTLVIDGAGVDGEDARAIRNALKSLKGIESVQVEIRDLEGGIQELLRPDLEREYATIYLLNVESLKGRDKKNENLPLEKLKQFVANGGNVVWFTGEKVDRGYYNDTLFEKSQGLFPIPIAEVATKRIGEQEISKRRNSGAPKIFVVDTEHEITRAVGDPKVQFRIPDLIIAQYTEAKDRVEWTRPWSTDTDLRELITQANLEARLDDSARRNVVERLKELPLNDAALKKSSPKIVERLQKFHDDILKVAREAREDEIYKVAEAIDQMLNDKGDKPGDKENVSLKEFWANPDNNNLKANLLAYRKAVLYGKPLAVTRKYGKGNVVAYLTTAGPKWNGWSGGELAGTAMFSYPMMIADLQKFLTRGGDGGLRLIGETARFELDPAQYKDEMVRFTQADEGKIENIVEGAPAGFGSEEKKSGQEMEGKLVFTFPSSKAGGVHLFRLFPKNGPPEERWFAFNVDTASESNLRRVASEEVAREKIRWTTPGESQNVLRERKTDASEAPWLYILFLIVLIAEQALAVHLSFHVKGSEAGQAAPARAAA